MWRMGFLKSHYNLHPRLALAGLRRAEPRRAQSLGGRHAAERAVVAVARGADCARGGVRRGAPTTHARQTAGVCGCVRAGVAKSQ